MKSQQQNQEGHAKNYGLQASLRGDALSQISQTRRHGQLQDKQQSREAEKKVEEIELTAQVRVGGGPLFFSGRELIRAWAAEFPAPGGCASWPPAWKEAGALRGSPPEDAVAGTGALAAKKSTAAIALSRTMAINDFTIKLR